MLRFLGVTAAAAVLAVPAGAAEIDPKALVLSSAELPAGFRLDRTESGVRTNAREGRSGAVARRLIARSGRVTGYEASWSKQASMVESRADLCRRPSGARVIFDLIELEMRKAGVKSLRRVGAGIGAESWVYYSELNPVAFTLVAWRHDRVFAGIVAVGLTKARTLALARAQQRRIVATLG